jgi:hypothetical protein
MVRIDCVTKRVFQVGPLGVPVLMAGFNALIFLG